MQRSISLCCPRHQAGEFPNIEPEIDLNAWMTSSVISTKKITMPYNKLLTNFTCSGPYWGILVLSRSCTNLAVLGPYCHDLGPIFIPNRTFLVRFGSISGEFGRAMVRILARRSRAKIPTARPNEPDMLPKRTKKGAIRYLPYPNSS